ncbi:unnamed protein product [Leptidea sinapis]|uniref:Uncharacterized protein n=1 Tax=Leptidea sinapis TaxID=189913 RepID=A0A5E4PMC6_9NEOP|nr:unnamed protein product [Leptidea sinapis]
MFSWSYCEDFHDGEIWNQKGMAKGVKHSQEAWLRLYRRLTVQDLCTNVVVSPGCSTSSLYKLQITITSRFIPG